MKLHDIIDIGWFFRIDKDDSNINISTMRSNLMELFTEPFSPKLYLDALSKNKHHSHGHGPNKKKSVSTSSSSSSSSSLARSHSAPASTNHSSNSLGSSSQNSDFIAKQSYLNSISRHKIRELIVDYRIPTMSSHPLHYNINLPFEQKDEIFSLFMPSFLTIESYRQSLQCYKMAKLKREQQVKKQSHGLPAGATSISAIVGDYSVTLPNNLTVLFKEDGRVYLPGNLILYPGCSPYELYDEYCQLNNEQKVIVQKMLYINDYLLLWGLPGTGKTTLLSLAIRIIVARNETILLTSYTHNSINHLLEKLLMKGMKSSHILRIGNNYQYLSYDSSSSSSSSASSTTASSFGSSSIIDRIQECTLETSNLSSISSLSSKISTTRIFITTILNASRNKILKTLKLNYCIIDEAGQITQPLIIGGLLLAEKFILVGDDKQLSPLVLSKEASNLGMNISLLKRLMEIHPFMTCSLTIQYRMNETIMSLCNTFIYQGNMKCGNEVVAKAIVNFPNLDSHLWNPLSSSTNSSVPNLRNDWLYVTLSPQNPVVYLNTDALLSSSVRKVEEHGSVTLHQYPQVSKKSSNGIRTRNITEANLVELILKALQQVQQSLSVSSSHHVAILTPFRAQLVLLQSVMNSLPKDSFSFTYEISTIDKYQGKDSDIVILSFVLSPSPVSFLQDNSNASIVPVENSHDESVVNRISNEFSPHILRDWKRINVALTRLVTYVGFLCFYIFLLIEQS
jgi:GTPase SAR1 family protein